MDPEEMNDKTYVDEVSGSDANYHDSVSQKSENSPCLL